MGSFPLVTLWTTIPPSFRICSALRTQDSALLFPTPVDWCRMVFVRLTADSVEEKTISNIDGNLQGLKPNQIHRLEKLYKRRIPPREIVNQEFARQLSEVSHEIHRQVGALVNRNGYVEYVIVGNARGIVLPDL